MYLRFRRWLEAKGDPPWANPGRDGRVVDGGGLENRFPERGRGFESYSLRHAPRRVHGCPELYVVPGAGK